MEFVIVQLSKSLLKALHNPPLGWLKVILAAYSKLFVIIRLTDAKLLPMQITATARISC